MANYFSIFLVILTAVSGLIWLADAVLWAPKRREKLAIAQANTQGAIDADTLAEIAPIPSLVDTAQQIFPVIAFVLVLRSFLYEPFQIPSGSMKPTLLVGDFILVEKFTYGLKDPVVRNKFYEVGSPERGDIVVFKYPEQPNIDYIKRVVGLPGDTIEYRNKRVYIKPACPTGNNCPQAKAVTMDLIEEFPLDDANLPGVDVRKFAETLGENQHEIYNYTNVRSSQRFYQQQGVPLGQWVVPEGHYFVLGDNRDNSRDSRFWGFVPDDNLVGKAVAIWMSFEFERDSSSFIPGWIPTGVRFERVGGIQ